MADENDDMPPNVLKTLKTASEEILRKQDGSFFSLNNESYGKNPIEKFSYDESELVEFSNFDMLGEAGDDLDSFNHLITDTNHKDLTGDRKVLKILLNEGKYWFFKLLLLITSEKNNIHVKFKLKK